MGDRPAEGPDRQALITILTTEHFTLQGARSSAIAETNSRLQIYMGFISMSILALALVAQVSRLGEEFFVFAFILLPITYLFGLATLGRLNQSWRDWFVTTQGMNRIRQFFVEVAPESARYLTLPTTDEFWTTLAGASIQKSGRLQGLVTAFAVVAIMNSILAGVLVGLVAIRIGDSGALAVGAGVGMFILSLVLLAAGGQRSFSKNEANAEVRFPADG